MIRHRGLLFPEWCAGGVCTAACPPTPPAPGVKRQSECAALPSAPISSSLGFRNETRMLQSNSSCKIALLPLSPPGKKAEQRSLPQHILAGEFREGSTHLGQVRRAGGWQCRRGSSGLSPTSHSCFPFPGTFSAGRGSRLPTVLVQQLSAPCRCFSAGRGSSWQWWCLCCSRLEVSVSVAPLLVFFASVAQLCLQIKYVMIRLVKFSRRPSST